MSYRSQELVQEGLPRKELEKVRRMLVEYGLSGWDMTYILPADKVLHDKIKEKRKRNGYLHVASKTVTAQK